ncbi:MAG: hypothetical protein CML51_06850 [Rhodobacteraceae bacterium]|nr:hypothetical protein [Paracoccaceae bacterium]
MQAFLPSVFRLVAHYRFAILLLVFVVSASCFLQGYLSFDNLREHRAILTEFRDANYLVAVVLFILVYTLFVAFSVPGGLLLSLTGGFLFATFPGVFYNMVGATLGASAIFLAARWGFGANLAATLQNSEGLVKKIKDGVDENQWSMLFLIRLVPGVPFFLANLVPSFLDVPLRRFVISTFLGIFPGALVFTSIGAGLGDIFERGQTPHLAVVWEAQIILPILGLCVLSALPVLLKLLRGKKGI